MFILLYCAVLFFYFIEIENLLDRICSVVDETYDLLNDTKNKPSDHCAHGKGLCKPENLLAAAKQIIRYLALGKCVFTFFAHGPMT